MWLPRLCSLIYVHSRYFNLDNDGQCNFVYSYKQSILGNIVKSRCQNLTKICDFLSPFFRPRRLNSVSNLGYLLA